MLAKKIFYQRAMLQGAALLVFGVQAVQAANVGVDVNIHLGDQPRQVVVAEPAYAAPAPAVVVEPGVQFIFPPALGFYVAVGVPYDLFYLGNSYFVFREGRWFRAPSSRGPWVAQRHRDLPPGLRRHRLERIREYRNHEYGIYQRDRDHYRGRHFRSGREEHREREREMKAERHELRREEKEQRKDEKRFEKEQRKDEKRFEKQERKEHRGRD